MFVFIKKKNEPLSNGEGSWLWSGSDTNQRGEAVCRSHVKKKELDQTSIKISKEKILFFPLFFLLFFLVLMPVKNAVGSVLANLKRKFCYSLKRHT